MEGVDGLSSSEDLTDDDIDREAAEEYAVTFGLPGESLNTSNSYKEEKLSSTHKEGHVYHIRYILRSVGRFQL